MGLLDQLLGAPGSDQSQAMGLLAAGLMKGDFGGGLLAANSLFTPEAKAKSQLGQLQLQQTQMSVDEMRRKLADEDATRKILQGIYSGNGMPQSPVGAPAAPGAMPSPSMGGMPQAQAPQSSAVTPKADVWQQYKLIGDRLASQGLATQAQQYYGLAEKMRPKFGTEPRIMRDPNTGQLVNVLVGEDGSTQVVPFGVKPDMTMQDLGGRVVAVDRNSLGNGQAFNKTQTPDSVASNAVTMRGQNMTDARAREQIQLGKVPAGYRQKPDGSLEFIPGGPADPNAAKKAAPTEFQGKSATFGARAQEADRILTELGTSYSPAGINTKNTLENVPMLGAVAGPLANTALSANSQKAEQAQRDFINAVLRQESGASINREEFDNARKQYFPQPGDSQAVIAQKARNRMLAINGFRANARPGGVDEVLNANPASGSASGTWDQTNDPLGLRR